MTQITIDLPDRVPLPKFKLFQQVRYQQKTGSKAVVAGTVVSMEYTAPAASLALNTGFGWSYSIAREAGIYEPVEELCKRPNSMFDIEIHYEEELING